MLFWKLIKSSMPCAQIYSFRNGNTHVLIASASKIDQLAQNNEKRTKIQKWNVVEILFLFSTHKKEYAIVRHFPTRISSSFHVTLSTRKLLSPCGWSLTQFIRWFATVGLLFDSITHFTVDALEHLLCYHYFNRFIWLYAAPRTSMLRTHAILFWLQFSVEWKINKGG